MTEIGHAAIDAGADIVIGHGPHYSLPVEVYRGKPIFYGLGSFSFHTGHAGAAAWRLARHDGPGRLRRGAGSTGRRFNSSAMTRKTERCCARSPTKRGAFDRSRGKVPILGAELAAEGDQVVVKLRA